MTSIYEKDGYLIWQHDLMLNGCLILCKTRGVILYCAALFFAETGEMVSFVVVWMKTCLRERITLVPFYQDRHLYG